MSKEAIIIESGADPLAAHERHSLLKDSLDAEYYGADGRLLEIESRKDRDQFFDSLGGWNSDDKIGKKQAMLERKKRKREEKEARLAMKRQIQHRQEFQMINLKNESLARPSKDLFAPKSPEM